ncbi:MAG TPA: peptidoglycan-binding protein [Fibrobacteria bacterium]|nr:peptidoglycan-binding protein [Fibrobacteria bacterium]HOX49968.1 peptidoglycan-binding protein [Fibrobacteria bacterium]
MERTLDVDAFRQFYRGGDLLDQSKAKPSGFLDWDKIESKLAASRSVAKTQPEPRYDSDDYLKRCREEDPWPEEVREEAVGTVSVSDCRFDLPDGACPDKETPVSCAVQFAGGIRSAVVRFRSFVQGPGEGPEAWTDLNDAKDVRVTASDSRASCFLVLHCPIPAPDLGSTLRYKVEASVEESKVESAPIETLLRIQCRTVGAPDLSWKDRNMVPVLDGESRWSAALKALLVEHRALSGSTVVVFGSGSGPMAREQAKLRAEWIRCLLQRDAQGWEQLRTKSTTRDVQAILSGLALCGEWGCHPGPVDGKAGPRTTAGLLAFETECQKKLSAKPKVDGVLDKQTWAGFLEALAAMVHGSDAAAPSICWGCSGGTGVFANGADFPRGPEFGVEICLFPPGLEPVLKESKAGKKLSIADNPTENAEVCQKTPIVVPWSPPDTGWKRRVRILGLTFDANKGFLLPRALAGLRQVVQVHKEFPEAKILVVAHAESDEIHAGIDLARHRAEMISAYLVGDAKPWLVCFGPSQYATSRWGTRELQLMLSALAKDGAPYFTGLASGVTDGKTLDAIRAFQGANGLKVDGKPGPKTREALVKAYMAIEDTTILHDDAPLSIGCEGGQDPSLSESGMVPDDRRVEVFFFEKAIRPYPSATELKGDVKEYRSWIDSLEETRDFETHGIHLKVLDEKQHPMGGVEVVLAGPNEVRATTDEHGFAEFNDLKAGDYSLRSADPTKVVAPVRIRYPTAKTNSAKGDGHGK